MKAYTVVTPPEVKRQITGIVLLIADDSIDDAIAGEERLTAALDALADVHGHAVDEVASVRTGLRLRKATFEKTHLIHYRVDGATATLFVVNVRDGRREPQRGEP